MPLEGRPQPVIPVGAGNTVFGGRTCWNASTAVTPAEGQRADAFLNVDLSGNALIMVPDEILVSRTGAPNRFRRPGVIKNVYRKNSSIVPRAFLLKPRYNSITEVMDEIESRGGIVSQATVSKVCASLDQDLVIERTKGQVPPTRSLRLIQPDKLLDLLTENYAPPVISQRLTAKATLTPDQFCRRVMQWGAEAAEKAALTYSAISDFQSMKAVAAALAARTSAGSPLFSRDGVGVCRT